jgi:hypothetical protein
VVTAANTDDFAAENEESFVRSSGASPPGV